MLEMERINPDKALLSDIVAQRLTQQIIAGAMMPGDTLPSEGDICRAMGVSKPVVREAVRKLAALGIVEIRQGKASTIGELAPEPVRQMLRFAMHINPDGLNEAVDLRRAIETHAAVRAAEYITDEEIDRLKQVLAQMEGALADHDRWVALDLEFHQLIARASHNSLIAFMINALSDSMREVISTLHAQIKVRDDRTIERHRAVATAIAARDPAAAEAAMRDHFAATRPVIEAIMAERSGR
ncbi:MULTISPECIES: FadR/GntR family transcriptional regulator [unclassified Sphingomonas]|jgi:GntR family transcriptional repressor for pyruvate dehydrogenase complex|uniref:FadR/GntR family transcriptional regulator n=2 Tax=unclassified Sphingomonas TaxID=196159 RepID=UPI00082A79CB|nr:MULTISPECIES: FadR/GntR family transcriptional regulator [unclassified Sphingomonas]